MRFKVEFSGFAYVEAENEEAAIEAYQDGNDVYTESGVDSVIEVDNFTVTY